MANISFIVSLNNYNFILNLMTLFSKKPRPQLDFYLSLFELCVFLPSHFLGFLLFLTCPFLNCKKF